MDYSHLDPEIVIGPDGSDIYERLHQILKAYQQVAEGIDEAFRQVDLSDTVTQTVRLRRHTEKFTGQLAYLRMNLGSLKAAFTEAFAPIGNLVLPLVNRAITRLRSLLHTVAAVLAAVTENIFGVQAVTKANDGAAKSYARLGAAAKRTLASFDQIQRLNGGSGSAAERIFDPQTGISEELREKVNKLLQWLQPLREINFAPLKAAFQSLWGTVQPLLQALGELLHFLWQAAVAPFLKWCIQTLLPVLTGLLTKAIETVTSALAPLFAGLKLIWDALQPVVEFIQSAVISALVAWRQSFTELAQQIGEKGDGIATVFYGLRQIITGIWTGLGPVLKWMRDYFAETFGGIGKTVMTVCGAILEGLGGLSEFLLGTFTGDFRRAWNGIVLFFKSVVNSLIGLLNAMLTKLTATLNAVVRIVSGLQFTVPRWVPGIGGQVFSIPMKSFQAPQIPYLAKGAVLPANKPFLAMVGDQKHGTNIEAPLDTIRQAVAGVMADYESANMAGHSATTAVLQQILEAVLGIEIGDETIARAAGRYQTKMAIVRGGAL